MSCYHPLKAYRSKDGKTAKGTWPVTFNINEAYSDLPLTLPCGQCIGCRLERSRQWAIRCVHEASTHEKNCFITLTFDQEHLDPSGSLVKSDFQKFMKRLRKATGSQIRYFHCGEYGEQLGRPHHHACLFGFDFDDKELLVAGDNPLYTSELLSKIWPYGHAVIGSVTFESAAYVARYVTKKITGPAAEEHYKGKLPEYTTMSRRPGIGYKWFEQFCSDVYPQDEVIIRGKTCRPPRFYDKTLDKYLPEYYKQIQGERQKRSRKVPYISLDRLADIGAVKLLNQKQLTRTYEWN